MTTRIFRKEISHFSGNSATKKFNIRKNYNLALALATRPPKLKYKKFQIAALDNPSTDISRSEEKFIAISATINSRK